MDDVVANMARQKRSNNKCYTSVFSNNIDIDLYYMCVSVSNINCVHYFLL